MPPPDVSKPSPPESPDAAAKAVAPAPAAPAPPVPASAPATPAVPTPVAKPRRTPVWKWLLGGVVVLAVAILGGKWVIALLGTVTTDDAYVNGHVTFVAPRVAGQVARVLVDDNNRVRKGDLLVALDPEPFQVQVNIAQAAVVAAQADLAQAHAQAFSLAGQVRSLRFNLDHTIEEVDNQIALLRSRVATLQSEQAALAEAQADFERGKELVASQIVTKEDFDRRQETLQVAQARVEEARQGVYEIRVALGLPPQPTSGDDLTQVPPDLDQTYSAVKEAQASLIQGVAQFGVTASFNQTPRDMIANFYKRDPQGDIDRILANLIQNAPMVKQAEAKLLQAQRNLDQANLNLRYCNIVSEIDGVVTGRNVNPGDNVVVGQSLMAVRSLTEIWIDANFKETQLGQLRIGQPVDLDVDMYGRRQRFQGRISGFTMGTGSTLALLPAENATGNFVKVVQRLPVRIEVVDYHPDVTPLFIGLSVTPTVYINAQPTGPNAGQILQPDLPTTSASTPATAQP
jgi:membrane fusion protein (multidrug efflux system)